MRNSWAKAKTNSWSDRKVSESTAERLVMNQGRIAYQRAWASGGMRNPRILLGNWSSCDMLPSSCLQLSTTEVNRNASISYKDLEGDIRTAHTALCTARAPRARFYQPFPAFFTFFQGGKDAVA